MQVLTTGTAISETFEIFDSSLVRLEGTLSTTWNVQSKRRDDAAALWQNEGDARTATTFQVIVEGANELEYRINVTGTATVNGFVYERFTRTKQ